MKTTILFFLTILSLVGCSKDSAGSKTDPIFQLPPETQTGANTFGVTIRGKVYVPRDPKGVNFGAPARRGLYLTGFESTNYNYTEINAVDGASATGFKIIIHLEGFFPVDTYNLMQSNFLDQVDSIKENHIYFKIYDPRISNYVYYGSVANQGSVKITRHSNGIIAGSFHGKFVRFDNPNEFIQINDGRFDINSFTIQDKIFP